MQAAAICPESPEPLQALASIQYEQGDVDAALETLRGSMSKWLQPVGADVIDDLDLDESPAPRGTGAACEAPEAADQPVMADAPGDEGVHVHGNHQEGDTTPELVQPSYEFRVECCKLLLELDTSTETALQVLASC